ncbi:hypothetical protein BOX15_Mlig025776g1, partial [Macrostomum lignano]
FAQSATSDVPPDLEHYLVNLSRSGITNAPWHLVKPLIRVKLESAIESFLSDSSMASIDDYYPRPNMETFQLSVYRQTVLSTLDQFTNAPFTIQRVCELALSPNKHYRRVDKYLRGLLKCLSVVSCIDPAGQKIVFDQDEEDMIVSNSSDSTAAAAAGAASASTHAGAEAAAASVSSAATADHMANDSLSGDDDLEEASGSGSCSGSGSEVGAPLSGAAFDQAPATAAEIDDESDDIESDGGSSSGCGAGDCTASSDAAIADYKTGAVSVAEAAEETAKVAAACESEADTATTSNNTPPVSKVVAADSVADAIKTTAATEESTNDNIEAGAAIPTKPSDEKSVDEKVNETVADIDDEVFDNAPAAESVVEASKPLTKPSESTGSD